MIPAEFTYKQAKILALSRIDSVLDYLLVLAGSTIHMHRKHCVCVLIGFQDFLTIIQNTVRTLSPACTVNYESILNACISQLLYSIDIGVTPCFELIVCSVPFVCYVYKNICLVFIQQILHTYPVIYCIVKI